MDKNHLTFLEWHIEGHDFRFDTMQTLAASAYVQNFTFSTAEEDSNMSF